MCMSCTLACKLIQMEAPHEPCPFYGATVSRHVMMMVCEGSFILDGYNTIRDFPFLICMAFRLMRCLSSPNPPVSPCRLMVTKPYKTTTQCDQICTNSATLASIYTPPRPGYTSHLGLDSPMEPRQRFIWV